MRFHFIAEFFDLPFKTGSSFLPLSSGSPHHTRLASRTAAFDNQSEEKQFWRECRQESLHTLKIALMLGSVAFLVFILLDLYTGSIAMADLPRRSAVAVVFIGLLIRLQLSADPYPQIPKIAKLSAILALTQLLVILVQEHNPQNYAQTWASVLPIYFFSYGQMFMTLSESVVFGLTAMLALPLGGYWIGLDILELLPSVVLLGLINMFGHCTRWRLENQTRKLFKARRMAEIAATDKVVFLRQIGHNLRQPLQALGCFASVLEAAYDEKPNDGLRHLVGRIAMTIDEVNNTCNRVLDIANLELGKQLPLITNVDINTLLASLEMQYLPLAVKRGIELKVCLRSKPPYMVQTDASILKQIIGNLLDNAIKYTESGWILVKVVKIDNKQLKLHIIDSGTGIDCNQQQKIFNDDYHGHRRCHENHIDGYGIGLDFVAKALKQLPQHRLGLYSKPGLGSDFQLYLPIGDTMPCTSTDLTLTEPGLSGLFIFIVDDDSTVLEALGEYFRNRGCEVETATSKADTQLVLRDCLNSPDLLITDYYLRNGETAQDIIAAIEAECGQIPTLILSAHAICDQIKNQLPATVGLLRKPANAAMLMEAISKLLKLKLTDKR
jgi:signal transduction histidine kinase/CheY-like chemotaxis protein